MKRLFLPWLILLTAAACGDQSTTPTAGDEVFDLPADQVAIYITRVMTQDGIRRSELTADSLWTFESSRLMSMKGVKMVFYEDNGREAGTLTADEGDHDLSGGTFIARGNVVLVTTGAEGGERRLETEELLFEIENDRIWSDKPFTAYEDGQTTTGTSFRSDAQFRTWEVTGGRTEGTVGGGGISF